MILKDAKVGQRVLVYWDTFPDGRSFITTDTNKSTIPATVLLFGPGNEAVLAWKDGEQAPNYYSVSNDRMDACWAAQGFTVVRGYGNHCPCLPYSEPNLVATGRQEAPCRNCGRNNDIGVVSCWLCECQRPTDRA